jgi:hypothetical protein
VTPEGARDGWLSADGKFVLARSGEGKYFYLCHRGRGALAPALAVHRDFASASRRTVPMAKQLPLKTPAGSAYWIQLGDLVP